MKHILFLMLVVGFLSGCQPDNPIPSYWNEDYTQYMEEFGYTYNETDMVILKNDIPIWSFPQNCFRLCVTSYIGPNGIHGDLLEDYNRNLKQSIEMYRQENLKILGLEE